mmetsp:Transcript_4140/g.8889  ORF Transcript_4140/g.8889 Transcript_4140/m.8889 type:complete len:223 (-) Transcript_4140:902-1570(-)
MMVVHWIRSQGIDWRGCRRNGCLRLLLLMLHRGGRGMLMKLLLMMTVVSLVLLVNRIGRQRIRRWLFHGHSGGIMIHGQLMLRLLLRPRVLGQGWRCSGRCEHMMRHTRHHGRNHGGKGRILRRGCRRCGSGRILATPGHGRGFGRRRNAIVHIKGSTGPQAPHKANGFQQLDAFLGNDGGCSTRSITGNAAGGRRGSKLLLQLGISLLPCVQLSLHAHPMS